MGWGTVLLLIQPSAAFSALHAQGSRGASASLVQRARDFRDKAQG